MCPLVILPGWGHGRESWEPLAERLAPREVHILELPGFGNEPLVRSDWGVPEYASWVRDKLEPLAPGRFSLLGHSFGGRIAALLAGEGVEGLSSLVLYGSPVLYQPTAGIRLRIVLAKLLKPFAPVALRPRGNAELVDAESRGMGAIFRKVVGFDQSAMLPNIRIPTLLLWGECDRAVLPAIAREAHGLIPDSELTLLPGLGHNAHVENQTLFAGTVSRFLNDHEHAAPLR